MADEPSENPETTAPNSADSHPDLPTSDDRSATARAFDWAGRAMTASLMMVLPCAIGIWLDRMLGTFILFTLLGLAFGMTGGILQLIKLGSISEK